MEQIKQNEVNESLDFYWDDAVKYIMQRCKIDRETIEEVMTLEEDYMRTLGIIDD